MVVGRALRAIECANCRLSSVRAFIGLNGFPVRLQPLSASLPQSRARYSSQVVQQNDKEQWSEGLQITSHEDVKKDITEVTEESAETSTVPWYLQIQTPQKVPQPLSDRQRIPDLPESPPAILQPLLKHISIDLGLDDLSLLDLRNLDPPPALGANLLMILGTARSERHLHVSADRLCRWLRSTYKLRPDADGLLGRNELKLKLRRKSRRAKLMGSASDDTGDDGIRTGWVCVDVGVVDGPTTAADKIPRDFVGFGRQTDGVRIVVQMLTDEKRLEIDLEKLWGAILKRGAHSDTAGAEDESVQSELLSQPRQRIGNQPLSILTQTRRFHTSTRNPSPGLEAQPSFMAPLPLSSNSLNTRTWTTHADLQDFQLQLTRLIESTDSDNLGNGLNQYKGQFPQVENEEWRPFVLQQLKLYLKSLSRDHAMKALGQGSTDQSSTPFLTCFYHLVSDFPPQAEIEAKIWLHSYAMDLGHGSYPIKDLVNFYNKLQIFGVKISRESYVGLLRRVLREKEVPSNFEISQSRDLQVDQIMEILQTMYDQGYDILTEEILVELQESSASIPKPENQDNLDYNYSEDVFGLPSSPMTGIQRRLHALINAADIPGLSDDARLRLLDLYSKQNYWRAFWDVWNMAPRRRQPQSAEMYAFMFSVIANTKNQRACMKVLRTWVSDLDQEIPEVKLEGNVAEAVKSCLKIADPFVDEDARGSPSGHGEWISLWRRCTEVEMCS